MRAIVPRCLAASTVVLLACASFSVEPRETPGAIADGGVDAPVLPGPDDAAPTDQEDGAKPDGAKPRFCPVAGALLCDDFEDGPVRLRDGWKDFGAPAFFSFDTLGGSRVMKVGLPTTSGNATYGSFYRVPMMDTPIEVSLQIAATSTTAYTEIFAFDVVEQAWSAGLAIFDNQLQAFDEDAETLDLGAAPTSLETFVLRLDLSEKTLSVKRGSANEIHIVLTKLPGRAVSGVDVTVGVVHTSSGNGGAIYFDDVTITSVP